MTLNEYTDSENLHHGKFDLVPCCLAVLRNSVAMVAPRAMFNVTNLVLSIMQSGW